MAFVNLKPTDDEPVYEGDWVAQATPEQLVAAATERRVAADAGPSARPCATGGVVCSLGLGVLRPACHRQICG